ncbi:hypothetical protein PV04_10152 [Phialophora macrospora]|uniref:Uncharacterized protein n=1 Tax=Phialophora macrospora TaxID=1851006 RepID=A0A0D2FTA2_9EURO|nr:hypothetical protein PV04_10152 [Phialophora macrospora]
MSWLRERQKMTLNEMPCCRRLSFHAYVGSSASLGGIGTGKGTSSTTHYRYIMPLLGTTLPVNKARSFPEKVECMEPNLGLFFYMPTAWGETNMSNTETITHLSRQIKLRRHRGCSISWIVEW